MTLASPDVAISLELNQIEAGEFVVGSSLVGGPDVIGDGLSEIQSDAARCSIRRGRWGQLYDDSEAATVSVILNNEDRMYDPSYASGSFYGELVPGRDIVIAAGGVRIFTGFVVDYDLEYDVSGRSVTVIRCTDALGQLGALQFNAWTNAASTAATKLNAICNRPEVDWPPSLRDFIEAAPIFGSVPTPLQGDNVSWGANVLNYIKLIAKSDWLSLLFASADGKLTSRPNVAWAATSWALPWGPTVAAAFGGSDIPFNTIRAQYGNETLYSEVSIDFEGGTAQTSSVADPAAWRESYGPLRRLSVGGLLLGDLNIYDPTWGSSFRSAEDIAADLADDLLAYYETPTFRIVEISIELAALGPTDQATVLGIDIADAVDIAFTPNGVGAAIEQTLLVQGISHDMAPGSHVVTFAVIDYGA